jgi:hypothetical protein
MLSQMVVHSLTSRCNQHEGSLAPACHRRVQKSVARETVRLRVISDPGWRQPKRTKELMCRLEFGGRFLRRVMKQSG